MTPHYNHHAVMVLLMSQQMFNMHGMLKKDILLCDLKIFACKSLDYIKKAEICTDGTHLLCTVMLTNI